VEQLGMLKDWSLAGGGGEGALFAISSPVRLQVAID
jgi:hypothetical protein